MSYCKGIATSASFADCVVFVMRSDQPAKPAIPNKTSSDNRLMNLFSIFQVSPNSVSPFNAHLGSFLRGLGPHLGITTAEGEVTINSASLAVCRLNTI